MRKIIVITLAVFVFLVAGSYVLWSTGSGHSNGGPGEKIERTR